MSDFRELPDLARRDLGGAVVWANDEAFALRQNLVNPAPATFDPAAFGPNGKVYDGWETRRRRPVDAGEPGADGQYDTAVVRLATPGIVRGVVVDTAHFVGNYPPEAAVDGLTSAGEWVPLLARTPIKGDTANAFAVPESPVVAQVRLRIFPDGGVARLRVHAEAAPDPVLLDALGTFDLVAMEYGGRVLACSEQFYGSPANLLLPGPARSMGEGWETARRRDDGNDWVEIALVAEGVVSVVELDTSWYLHNAPGWASLHGRIGSGEWFPLLERTALEPDTRHRFPLTAARACTAVRLDAFPDGGMARLRLWGSLTDAGRAAVVARAR